MMATILNAAATSPRLNASVLSPLVKFEHEVRRGRFQQFLALSTALFAALAGGEAFFEHLRGSFCQRVMWTPVLITPFVVGAGIGAAFDARVARTILPFTALVSLIDGLLGFYFHLKTVREMPGGLRNFWFKFSLGPPLFAPLLFCAVGLMGLIASVLQREEG